MSQVGRTAVRALLTSSSMIIEAQSTKRSTSAAGPLEPAELAAKLTSSPREQASIVRNLASFPQEVRVLGVFFVGLARVIEQARGPAPLAELGRTAGAPANPVVFR